MPHDEDETYFGLLSPAQTIKAEAMLSTLGIRYRLHRMSGVEKSILVAWHAADESSALGDAVDLLIQTNDLERLGDAFVQLFPDRRFDS